MKKKSKSILAIVLAILLVIVVAISLTTNILFSRKDTPKIFGHYIYLMEYDTMEAAAGAAVATGTSGQAGVWAACCSAFSASVRPVVLLFFASSLMRAIFSLVIEVFLRLWYN